MKKLVILVLVLLCMGGCARLRHGETTWTRFGPVKVQSLKITTKDGTTVDLKGYENTEANETLEKIKDLVD